MRRCSGLMMILLLVQPLADAGAATILIKPDGTGDYPTIQDGLDNSMDNDEILLAPGTYTGAGNSGLHLKFGVANLTITSQAGAATTIMDCGGTSNWLHSFSSFTEDTAISGVTVTNAIIAINVDGSTDVFGTTVEDCIFLDSKVGFKTTNHGQVIIRNNVFRNLVNPGGDGSALTLYAGVNPVIENNVFENNSARLGGAAFISEGSTVTGNVFAYNTATIHAGAIWGNGSCTITNNTFVANEAALGSSGIYMGSGTISNNILAFSPTGEAMVCSTALVTCNNVFGNGGGDALCKDDGNNISVDPGFCGVLGTGNYYLQSTSACTAANSPCGSLIGALPVGCGTVGIEEASWGLVKGLYRD